MSQPLDADTRLDVRLSAVLARNQFVRDPAPVIDELRAAAGERVDVLARTAGMWAGYHEVDQDMRPLVTALREIPGAADWVALGRQRRGAGPHSTPPVAR